MPRSLNNRLRFITATILALLIGVVLLWGWLNWLDTPVDQGATQIEIENITPEDSLLLSYGWLNPDNDSAALLPSLYDFTSGTPRTIGKNPNGDFLTGFHHSLSSNGEWMTFIDVPSTEVADGSQTVWPTSVYRINVPDGNIHETVRAITVATSTVENALPAFPVISNDGVILYMTPVADTEIKLDLLPEEWNIVMVDMDNNERVLIDGSHPRWLDESSFLFFKNDGIYRYSLNDSTEALVLNTLTPVTGVHRFGLDNLGQQAWLIEPGAGATRIFDLSDSNGTVTLKEKTIIMGSASSAIFSPEGEHIAIIMVSEGGEEIGLPLIIYDSSGTEVHRSFLPYASLYLTSLQAWVR